MPIPKISNLLEEKLPPQALDAEMAVLGSMLMEAEAVERALEILKPEHFYKDAHKKIFSAMKDLAEKGQAVDLVTVTEALKTANLLAKLGGEVYLTELVGKVSTAAHIEHYANIVYRKAVIRELIRTSTALVQKCYQETDEPQELLDEAADSIYRLSQKQRLTGFVSTKDMAPEVLNMIENAAKNKSPIQGVPTGLTEFDYKTGGFRKSDLIILGARPSQGKTALALNMAHFACVTKGFPVAIFSLEMGRHSLFERMLGAASMTEVSKLRNGWYDHRAKWGDLLREYSRLAEAPMYIDDTSGISITEIRMRSRRLASELAKQGKELGLIIIDYLQLIRGSGRTESRQQEVSEISRQLKDLARTLNVPVLALSQLSRKNEDKGRQDNKPQLSDLRESGSIEQDADVVALIHRDGYYKRDDPSLKNKATLIIAKQRNGPVGEIPLHFIGEYTLFTNPTPEEMSMPEGMAAEPMVLPE